MTVYDVIERADRMLGLGIAKQCGKLSKDVEDCRILLTLLSDVVRDVCLNYFPLTNKLTVRSDEGGFVSLCGVAEVISLFCGGSKVNFRAAEGEISTDFPNSVFTAICRLEPPKLAEFEQNIVLSNGKVTEETLAFGVAERYSACKFDFAAAEYFGNRYREALRLAMPRRRVTMPQNWRLQ